MRLWSATDCEIPHGRKILWILATGFALGSMAPVAAAPNTPLPQTRVQIVNATSVPEIALSVNGRKSYPHFRQGLHTADGPTTQLEVQYQAEIPGENLVAKSPKIPLAPNRVQTVVILGDFSTDLPAKNPPPPDTTPRPPRKPQPPRVSFRVYPHDQGAAPVAPRLRVINGLPGKSLTFATRGKPSNRFVLKPGEEKELDGQPATAEYTATIDGQEEKILLRQEGLIRNAMVVFYLDEKGEPKFKRVFENQ